MKYGQTIRELAARGQNWRFYDENFRFLRGTQASLVPWNSIHAELWLRSQFPAKALPSNPQVNGIAKSGGPSVLSGYLSRCFKFHRGQFCSAVNHTCFKCKKEHIVLVSVIFVAQQVKHPPTLTVRPSLPTPVKLTTLVKFLAGYPTDLVTYITSGFLMGFPLHFQGRRSFLISRNLTSALENPTFVDKKLGQELAADRIAGPFTSPPFQSFLCFTAWLNPKKNTWRLQVNTSFIISKRHVH